MPGLRVGKDDESRDDEDGESADDLAVGFAPIEMTVWTGRRLEVWALDAAGRWTVVGSANSRRGRPRPFAGDRRFEPATLAPFRGEFVALWVRSLTAEWVVAGEYGDGSQGQVPDATWIFRRLPSGWQFSALDGDDVRDHLIWPDDRWSVSCSARTSAQAATASPTPTAGSRSSSPRARGYAPPAGCRCRCTRRKFPLRLPMASLKGSWSLGPEGLAPGC